MARYVTFSQTASAAAKATVVTDMARAIALRTTEAPYELFGKPQKFVDITDADGKKPYADAVSAKVTCETLPNSGKVVNRVSVTLANGTTVPMRVYRTKGKDATLLDPKDLDIKSLMAAFCQSGGKVITDRLIENGTMYEVPRLYAVLD